MEKSKVEKLFRETASNLFEALLEDALEDGKITEKRAEITRKKYNLQAEEAIWEDKLHEVTHNTYDEVGDLMNELLEKRVAILEETYLKIKKYLDDNNLPYEEDDEEDNNEEV